jgi:hypothetical protein
MNMRFRPDCPACEGKVECKGGGNQRCIQRDPKPSRIGGILDSYGGVRVVVTHRSRFKHHVRAGEFLCLVPGIDKRVHEPIAWNDIPFVIRLGEIAVEEFVKANESSNDPEKREAIRAWRSRQTWNRPRALDLEAICYT